MTNDRWATHRVYDAAGNDKTGPAAINLWWLARAAAEETMQGSPLAAAWLKLFRTQLSQKDPYWLRWRGDLAESAELRRAYSGLYGRFIARALLKEHLGLSRFLSLERNGVTVPGAIQIKRSTKGDIPDWLAWDDRNATYVLGEAKGSLTARDFLNPNGPKCVREGKKQFDRVVATEAGLVVKPARWVAATRWATDDRRGDPITVLWDPPVPDDPQAEELAPKRREAMTRAWLDSLAPALGYRTASDLISDERNEDAIIVRADPGEVPESLDWPVGADEVGAGKEPAAPAQVKSRRVPTDGEQVFKALTSGLQESEVYSDSGILEAKKAETKPYEGAYIAAAITPFGIRPIRSTDEFEGLKREQDRAQRLETPVMLAGIPLDLDPKQSPARQPWLDGAGIAQPGELALFDLRRVEVRRHAGG